MDQITKLNMQITVIGGGYVGLVSAICFCEFGFNVSVIETNPDRLKRLKSGKSTVLEVGVEQSLRKHMADNVLSFSGEIDDPIKDSDAIVIAVATTRPGGPDLDLTGLHDVIRSVALSLPSDRYVGIFLKTSVPVGTTSIISNNISFLRPDLIQGKHYDIICNPEFLREGSAIHDFMNPRRIIIGTDENYKNARELVSKVYATAISMNIPILYTNFETAELIRAATIAFSALKMAFVNEMADFCNRAGADINTLIRGIALEQWAGLKMLKVSPGIGGTSVPRAIRSLQNTADSLGIDMPLLEGVLKSNANRISGIKDVILRVIDNGEPNGAKKISIWGLTFKPKTGDIRESASIFVVNDLLDLGLQVFVFDPIYKLGSSEISKIPEKILNDKNFHICESVYESANQADLVVIMTDWAEFMSVDFNKIYEIMNKDQEKAPIILDYRNMFTKSDLPNFSYISQGTC